MDEARTEEMQGLRAEIDRLNVVANDKNRSIDKLEEAVAVFQYNIGQYRDLVSSLQSDVQRLREREQAQATEAATVSSRTQEMESLSLQLRSTILKTKAKTIDLEMRRLEADQATEQLHLTAPFLPDHFYRSENEALKTMLAFKRLEAKGNILCAQLEQEEKTDAAISDGFVATAEIRALLAQLSGYAGLFVSFLSTCSASEFMRLGSLLHDAQGIERRLNGLIDLLRNEEFRASETLPEIRRLAAQVLGLADAHVPVDSQAMAGPKLGIMVARLAYGSDVQVANLFYIEQLLASGPAASTSAEDDKAVGIPFTKRDQQRIAGDVLPAVTNVVQSCRACKAVALKLLRRSDDLVRSGSVLSGRALEQFAQLVQTNRELSDYCVRSRTVIQDYFATAAAQAAEDDTERTPVSLGRLLQDINGIAHDVFGASDAMPMGLALGVSQRLGKELGMALASVGDSNNVCKIEAVEAPWISRAKHFKASLVQNADVQRRTEALNEEIISLARELKVRDQAIQEYSVKTEMLGKRAEVARKQADQMREMQRELENKKSDLDAYEGATAVLEDEIRRLKHEKKKLLEQQQQATNTAAAAGGAMPYDDAYSTLGAAATTRLPTDLLSLRSKIAWLQESVAYLRKENAHMRAKYQFREEMHVLTAEPLLMSGPLAEEGSSEIGVVVREAKAAAMEARRLAAMPKLVRLAAAHGSNSGSNRAAAVWQPLSSRPQFDLYRQQTLAQALKRRAEGVQDRLRSITRSSHGLLAVHLAD
ncbi:hypothetical protein GGI23_004695 [Coemansia sp. RSA 2559]|nr:hypothetical protein GGI23_004695 [Coemansia sp. RSA 2559]